MPANRPRQQLHNLLTITYVHWDKGIEFSTTYVIMLLALMGLGRGRYHSLDYWLQPYVGRKLFPANRVSLN